MQGRRYSTKDALGFLSTLNEDWNKTHGKPSNLSAQTLRSFGEGKAILVGDEYYDSDMAKNYSFYVDLKGNATRDNPPVWNDIGFLGYDSRHNSYWNKSSVKLEGKRASVIRVYNKIGKHLSDIR